MLPPPPKAALITAGLVELRLGMLPLGPSGAQGRAASGEPLGDVPAKERVRRGSECAADRSEGPAPTARPPAS